VDRLVGATAELGGGPRTAAGEVGGLITGGAALAEGDDAVVRVEGAAAVGGKVAERLGRRGALAERRRVRTAAVRVRGAVEAGGRERRGRRGEGDEGGQVHGGRVWNERRG